jgi:ABC-2 type transport system ATP-binding protein
MTTATKPPPILFEDVHRQFDGRPVLRGLSLQVRPGQVHALLGRNGCGKTTAIRILLGLLAPHRGTARLLGVDSRALRPEDRARVGYVSEGHRLYGGMRVGEVIAFEAGTRPGFRRDDAAGAARRCGLPPGVRVGQLSRGQRAQLALIVAMASEPELLVLDDPALGLDVVMRRELLDVMIELLADRGLSVLFSSHFLDDVERVADRVSLLHEGRLLVDAPLDELKRRVERRLWSPGPDVAEPPRVRGLLRSLRRRGGFELTLLDADADVLGALAAHGARLGEAHPATLEELFIDLTRKEGERILPAPEERAA